MATDSAPPRVDCALPDHSWNVTVEVRPLDGVSYALVEVHAGSDGLRARFGAVMTIEWPAGYETADIEGRALGRTATIAASLLKSLRAIPASQRGER